MKRLRLWGSLLVSLVFLWFVFRGIDTSRILAGFRNASYLYLVPAIALYFVGVWVRSVRWKVLLNPIATLSLRALFPVVVIGYMANDILPARMGEFVRVYVLGQKEQVPRTSALGTIVIERVLDAITMLLLLATAALAVPLNGNIKRVAAVAVLVLGVGILLLGLVVVLPQFSLRTLSLVTRVLPSTLEARITGISESFISGLSVVRSVRTLAGALALSVVAWLFEGSMYFVLAQGFHLSVAPSVILMTLAVANLATLVPAAPGYLGTFEAGAKAVLSGLAGIPWGIASGYILLLHAALVVPVSLLGLYYWSMHHLSLHKVRTAAGKASTSAQNLNATAAE